MIEHRKNNIAISDYNYNHDIINREMMANLSHFEVEVLKEIVNGSLQITTKQLASHFQVPESHLANILDKLSEVNLLERKGNNIIINKEMRRYYETQISKFDDEFQPDMDFLKGMLSKVPIHILPTWYSTPPMTNNIVHSIIESYLKTPRLYQRYLNELKFSDPVLTGIVRDLFKSPDFTLSAQHIMETYQLSRRQFEEYLLHLEYHLVCCHGFNRSEESWEEVITPLHEWRSYLRFKRDNTPAAISNPNKIERLHAHDFGFAYEMARLVELAQERASVGHWDNSQPLAEQVRQTAINLDLLNIRSGVFYATGDAEAWMAKPIQNWALDLFKHSMEIFPLLAYKERDLREVQASLQAVSSSGWILLDDFIKSFTAPLGEAAVTLQCKGRKWHYAIPEYTSEDKAFIERVIWGPLYAGGLVAVGQYQSQPCFTVTSFGKDLI